MEKNIYKELNFKQDSLQKISEIDFEPINRIVNVWR